MTRLAFVVLVVLLLVLPSVSADIVTIWTGTSQCSPDRTQVMEVGYICVEGVCTPPQASMTTRLKADCASQGTFCNPDTVSTGICGCPAGFIACEEKQQCVQPAVVQLWGACSCDIECGSGYCEPTSGTCFNILDIHVSSTDLTLEPGKETTVTLTISNNLAIEISGMSATLNIGSGAEITDISSGMDCSVNQCKYAGKVAGRGREEVRVKIVGNSEGTIPLSATVTFTYKGKEHAVTDEANVVVAKPVTSFSKFMHEVGNWVAILLGLGFIFAVIKIYKYATGQS